MSVIAGPNLINTGLVLHIDPANPACFTPGETTCKNLITDGLVTGANGSPGTGTHIPNPLNFPTYSAIHGGIFDFAGGQGMNCEEDLGKNTELTLIVWFYKIGLVTEYLTDARADGGQWFLTNYTSRNITYTNAVSYNFTGTYADSPPGFLNAWHMVTVTAVTGATGKMYLNGTEVSPYVDQTVVNPVLGKNFRIGTRFTNSNLWTGYMGPVIAYNRVLSAQEISQNFQVLRGRYGI